MQLEDKHIQLDIDNHKELLDYDVVLRLNDKGDGYAGFELVHYPSNEILTYVEFKK